MKKHGTNSTYAMGCRCDECRAAHTSYTRDRRAGVRGEDNAWRPPGPRAVPDRPWEDTAACKAPGENTLDWFPQAAFRHGRGATHARAVCAVCPVKDECLDYAMETREPFGIWGGLDEDERRLLRRRMQRQARMAS